MTIVGVLCIALGLVLSLVIAVAVRSPMAVLLFFYHTAASLLYWLYSLQQPADASSYFTAPYSGSLPTAPGTAVVRWLTAGLREMLHASYLDMFMIFHLAGYVGIVLFWHQCRDTLTSRDDGRVPGHLAVVVALLPGLHIWTSAIGKDGLMFLGISCFLWGAARRNLNIGMLILGLAICSAIRPHIAFLLASSCTAALMLSNGVRFHWRIAVIAMLCVGLWMGLPHLQEFLKVDELSSDSVRDFVVDRQGRNLGGGSSLNIADYSLPFQLFTFMYRPLFFDAGGFLGLVVSLENAFYLGLSLLYLPRVITTLNRGQDTFFVRFNLIYWLLGTVVLASTTANLGLAIRQKQMIVPSLILISLAVFASERQRRLGVESEPEGEKQNEGDAVTRPA